MKSILPILFLTLCTFLGIQGVAQERSFAFQDPDSKRDTLKIKLSWYPNRVIVGDKTKPVALVGVYKKIVNTTDTIQDIYNSIAYLNFPQVETSSFKQHTYRGFKILNLDNAVYKNDTQFWEEYNLPWLKELIETQTTIYVLSNATLDQLKYQFIYFYPQGPIVYKYFTTNNQLMRTGFGKEIEYLDAQIKQGYYRWNEHLGAYQPIN
ncbi:hypothetical protein [Myroides odoratus]|uniref:hypothetical protein n=1 Tax=Myroides odoratus TaxID=256 RepID=UPI0039B04569